MKTIWVIVSLLVVACSLYADGNLTLPAEDRRMIRELESQSYGTPHLADDASRGQAVEALAGLAVAASASTGGPGNFQNSDYDALYSLLQRYRDDLLKMGMDATDLDSELKILKVRADELSDRLNKLKPKDGLKIHGRVYAVFDDLDILGNDALPMPSLETGNGAPAKLAGQAQRYQEGVTHSELVFEGIRGPFTGHIEVDGVALWGYNSGAVGFREVYLELQLPIVLQVGNIRTDLSPLTLWRNEDSEPFEPEPFSSRRERLLDDLHSVPNEWELEGARASTDVLFFGRQRLELESITAIVGNAGETIYNEVSPPEALQERFNTYMEGWRAALPLGQDFLKLSYNGLLFWDVNSTSVLPPVTEFRSLNALVQTGRAEIKAGLFHAEGEYALSSYTPPSLSFTAMATPMTGTALVGSIGISTDRGYLKIFGRDVSNGYFAPGAQGRTQDWNYQYLGPFPTENSQINADGTMNVPLPGMPNFTYESSFNDVLIPPGTITQPGILTTNTWQHLLPYGPTQLIDPYGDATPNRMGFGIESQWKFFDGTLKPLASYESFQEVDAVSNTNSVILNPFSINRIRAGGEIDLKPLLGWPLRFKGGYTAQQSSNGGQSGSGTDYDLMTLQTEAGAAYDFSPTVGANLGYRHLDVHGLNETFDYSIGNGDAWDIWGAGLWWKPVDDLRMDMVYTQQFSEVLGLPTTSLEVNQGVVRLTFEF